MAIEAPNKDRRGLKLPKGSDLISAGIEIITPERTLAVFSSFFQYREAKGYRGAVRYYLERGYYPVGVLNHYVHFDGVAYAIASNNLVEASGEIEDASKRIKGCYGLHQGTMESGAQGEELQTYMLKLEQAAQEMGLRYLPWITPDHVKRYKLGEDEKKIAEVKRINNESATKMELAPSERIALLTFPAGNMKAARGSDKGMVESDLTWITQMATFLRNGVKIVFLPGVITDSFRISDPDTRNLTPEAMWSFARNLLARSTLPLRPSEAKLATLTMLPPYSCDRLASDLAKVTGRNSLDARNLRLLASVMHANKELTDQLIMGTINDELPEERKGTYYKGYKSFGLGDYAASMY